MHIGKIYAQGNIVYHKEVATYYYSIKPINSIFASNTQNDTILQLMKDKILSINMPGEIMIRPVAINGNKIVNSYKSNFKKYGFQEFVPLAKDFIRDIQELNCKEIKYRYEIYMMFTDGRDDLKRKRSLKIFGVNNDKPSSDLMEIFETCNQEIYKKLSGGLDVRMLAEEDTEKLHNYMAMPEEKKIANYYVTEAPSCIRYDYKEINTTQYKTIFSKTMVASKFDNIRLEKDTQLNDVVNGLQLLSFPSDVIIKFDLEHTKEFVRDMNSKREKIRKANKRHRKLTERNDKDAIKAEKVAMAGENVDESAESSKVRWQMFIRLRANSERVLEKRSDIIRNRFRGGGSRITLSDEIGSQLKLANNVFPYRNEFRRYVQLSDVSYFVHYNYLGGLFIGDDEEGMVITYTMPGRLPVFHDSSRSLRGETKSTGSTTILTGETGSGKTQLADGIVMTDMIFKGHRTLVVDPKGDREAKIEMLGESASHLKIGSSDCPDGMFDPYLMNDNETLALAQAKNDISSLSRALNSTLQINFMSINEAHKEMIEDKKAGKIKQLTFVHLLNKLSEKESYLADQVLSLRVDPTARLFFGTDFTKVDKTFNLNKRFNLITFDKMPLYNSKENRMIEFNPNQVEHAVFAVVFSRVVGVINGFMKRFGTEENSLLLDEFKVFKSIPGGEDVAVYCNRQCRSWQTHLYIISQLLDDIPKEIIENSSELFIGSVKSTEALDSVLSALDLSEHNAVRKVLEDKTKSEGVTEDKKYNFLYQDYNNRKCLTKWIIPKCFAPYFDTHLKEKEEVVPVTGTTQEQVYESA